MEDGGAFNPPLPQIGDRLGPFMLEEAKLSFNQSAARDCFEDLDSLTCNDPEIISFYDPRSTEDYSNVHRVFGASVRCSQIGDFENSL